MSVGPTIAERHPDYSPTKKPIVPTHEIVGRSDETRDDRRHRHAFAKSDPSSTNTCVSESDEADYETSSEGPSRLVEGKSSHTRFLSKSRSGDLQKDETSQSTKTTHETEIEEKSQSRTYTYNREVVEQEDEAIGSVSLPILRSTVPVGNAVVGDRMISDSSFARRQKLRMIVEQTEFLLSTESRVDTSRSVIPETIGRCSEPVACNEYELSRRESLMLLPVIQDVKSRTSVARGTIEIEKTIRQLERGEHSMQQLCRRRHGSRDLIDIAENPDASSTSFYLPPYSTNYERSYRADDSVSSMTTTTTTGAGWPRRRGRVSNDAEVILKIHGELSPLRCELGEIAAKFRALKYQRMTEPFLETKENPSRMVSGNGIANASIYAPGYSSRYAFLHPTDIDRGGGSAGGGQGALGYVAAAAGGGGGGVGGTGGCLVGNSRTQFSPITMVGKSNSRASCCPSSIGTNRFLAPSTGFPCGQHRSYDRHSSQICSLENFSIGNNDFPGEKIESLFPRDSSFERYRPASSRTQDRYRRSQPTDIARSSSERPQEPRLESSFDTNERERTSRTNPGEPPDLLILDNRKETIRERNRRNGEVPSPRTSLRRKEEDLRDSVMANERFEHFVSGDGASASRSLCNERRDSLVRCSKERSIHEIGEVRTEDVRTSTVPADGNDRRSRSYSRYQETEPCDRQLEHGRTRIVDRSAQTSTETMDCHRSNVSSISERRIRAINVPTTLERVKIVPVLFTAGIPEPLLPFFRLDDSPARSNYAGAGSTRRVIRLEGRNSRIYGPSSGKRGPLESETSGSCVTGPLALPVDCFSRHGGCRYDAGSGISLSCLGRRRGGSSKKISSAGISKYEKTLLESRVPFGIARVTVSGSSLSEQRRERRQTRETSIEKGIRGMRSSPEDFLCDT